MLHSGHPDWITAFRNLWQVPRWNLVQMAPSGREEALLKISSEIWYLRYDSYYWYCIKYGTYGTPYEIYTIIYYIYYMETTWKRLLDPTPIESNRQVKGNHLPNPLCAWFHVSSSQQYPLVRKSGGHAHLSFRGWLKAKQIGLH